MPPDLWERHYRQYRRHARESRLYSFARRLVTGSSYFWPDGTGRVLDIGCGNAAYLSDLERRGWQGTGYEPSPELAAAVTEGTGIRVESDPDALPGAEFDLVTMNFVLEHSQQPHDMLALAVRCCRPGGRVVVTLPDPGGREAAIFGDRWFHLDPPRHLVLPTRSQASEWFARAGLAVEEVRSLPVATGVAGSLSYRLFGGFNPLAWAAFTPPGMLFCQFVRDGLFMVVGRRPA